MPSINTCEKCGTPHDLITCGYCFSKVCIDCARQGFDISAKICTSCYNVFINKKQDEELKGDIYDF